LLMIPVTIPEFALEAAKVFAGNGIKAFLFDELRPTPELSFTVRHLNAAAGVVITASHNPRSIMDTKFMEKTGTTSCRGIKQSYILYK